nr:unnamed protein product [Callosobruchus chinensis]
MERPPYFMAFADERYKELYGDCLVLDADNISDHKLVTCQFKLVSVKQKQKFIKKRNFNDFNDAAFLTDLSLSNLDDIYLLNNIDDKVDHLTAILTDIFNKHAPLRIVRVNKPHAPWLNDDLRKTLKEKDRLFSLYKANKTEQNLTKFKKARNAALLKIRNEKKAYLEQLSREKNDSKELWTGFRHFNVNSRTKPVIPDFINDPDQVNDYFMSVYSANDVPGDVLRFYIVHHFGADDFENPVLHLQADMGRVCNYSSDHNLVINPNKPKNILFCTENRRDHLAASFQIHINGLLLAYVDVARV